MSDTIEMIAMPNRANGADVDDLMILTEAVEAQEGLILSTVNGVFVSFIGDRETVADLVAAQADRFLFEENKTIQMIQPVLTIPGAQISDIDTNSVVKDEDDIVSF